MVKHIVLLEFAKDLPTTKIEQILLELGQLINVIPQIKNYSYGKNNSPEGLSANFNYGFTMEFKTITERDDYLQHPAHVQFASNQIIPNLSAGVNSVLVFDYSL